MSQKLITMTEEELFRYEIINKLIAKEIKAKKASILLNVSIRQIKRLKVKVREKGAEGLIHQNRGKESNRKIDPETIKKAKRFLKEKYSDFGPTFAAEKLIVNPICIFV
ncbi:hypothetical protein KKH63_00955 [Patescibacteria group bacterium]|nr:hypothetical protein [Patescibacteria group bacterium]